MCMCKRANVRQKKSMKSFDQSPWLKEIESKDLKDKTAHYTCKCEIHEEKKRCVCVAMGRGQEKERLNECASWEKVWERKRSDWVSESVYTCECVCARAHLSICVSVCVCVIALYIKYLSSLSLPFHHRLSLNSHISHTGSALAESVNVHWKLIMSTQPSRVCVKEREEGGGGRRDGERG